MGEKIYLLTYCVLLCTYYLNVGVADYMMAARDSTSFLTGKSTHNQRIERLWRDVFESCLQPFHNAFM